MEVGFTGTTTGRKGNEKAGALPPPSLPPVILPANHCIWRLRIPAHRRYSKRTVSSEAVQAQELTLDIRMHEHIMKHAAASRWVSG